MEKEMIRLLKDLKQIALTPNQDIDLEKSALLLLQFNRNRILYQNIIRARLYDKLKYEAVKMFELTCARYGLDPETFDESPQAQMDEMEKRYEAAPEVEVKEKSMGVRPDHDTLPDNIRALYQANTDAYLRMRKLHEALKNMDAAKACDRFPYVKEFLDLDDLTVKNWTLYDSFNPEEQNDKPEEGKAIDAKRISANRKYLSDNKDKLAKLIADNSEKAHELRDKMQLRVTELLSVDAGVSDDQLTELAKLGINV